MAAKSNNDAALSDEDRERSKSAEDDETVVKENGKEENDDVIDGEDKEQALTEKPENLEVCDGACVLCVFVHV